MTDDLTRLAVLQGTDKFGLHDYTPRYHALLRHLRGRPIRLLEIGVGGYKSERHGGESLAMWRDYFPKANIVGIDIEKKSIPLGDRVRILQGSQIDTEFLDDVVARHGPFDVIVDDGSHQNAHVIATYAHLFPTLVAGGIYIVEDVQTAFFPSFGGSADLAAPNSIRYFSDRAIRNVRDPNADEIRVDRFHNVIAIHKKESASHPVSVWQDTVHASDVAIAFSDAPATDRAITWRAPTDVATGTADVLHDTLDAWTDETRLASWLEHCTPKGKILLTGTADGWDHADRAIASVFRYIDYVEELSQHRDAAIPGSASQIINLSIFPDGVALQLGDNSYPSNFDWSADHPLTAAAMVDIEAILQSGLDSGQTTQNGLLRYAGVVQRYMDPHRADWAIRALDKTSCDDLRYFKLSVPLALQEERWDDAIEQLKRACNTYPDQPHFAIRLGGCLARYADDLDAAEAVYRAAQEHHPDDLGLITCLHRTLAKKGDMQEAITLAETTLTKTGQGAPVQRRLELARYYLKAGTPEKVAPLLSDLAQGETDAPGVAAMLEKARRLMSVA